MSDDKKTPTGSLTSRRDFLEAATKSGSIAALIASGALDPHLRSLLLAAERRTSLSNEALTGRLPTESLTALRDLLKGEYYRGGKYFKGGVAEPPTDADTQCGGEANGPDGCPGDHCDGHHCAGQVCTGDYHCGWNSCDRQTCGGFQCLPHTGSWEAVDTRKMPALDLGDIRKHATGGSGSSGATGGSGGTGSTGVSNFLDEMMEIHDMDIRALEKEIHDMIMRQETFRDRGYVK